MLEVGVPVRSRDVAAAAGLALILAVVSWHTATNLGGTAGGVVYAVACGVVIVGVLPVATRAVSRGPAWVLPALLAVVVAVLVALFVLGFPAAYGHAMGVGSDRSDALDVALARLADGRYPYEGVTYLGNPITPLPGALLMAAPFAWLTGDAAWQNVAGLLLLLPLLNRGSWRRVGPTLLWACVALGGLEVVREFVVGDDLVTGAVPAVAAAAWTLALARGASAGALVAAGTALGIATCTRPHLALVVMVVAAAVGALAGWRRAVLVGATASAGVGTADRPVPARWVGPVLAVARRGEGHRGPRAHARDRRRRAGGGGAAAGRARHGPAVDAERRGLALCRRAVRPVGAVAGPAARGRTGRGARPDAGGRGGAVRPVGGERPPPGHGRRVGPAGGPPPRRGAVRGELVEHGTRRIALALGAGVAAASLVVLTLGLPTGRTFGVEDNGDGFRLFCGLGMVPRTIDRIAAWKGGVVTDFAVVASPTCGMSTPSSAALVLRAAMLGGDGSVALSTVAWWYAVLVGLVVATAAWAASASGLGRAAVLVVPVAPLALPAFTRFFVSTYGEPAGLLGALAVACGIAALLVTRPGQRAARTVALTLTALGGAVAATAKVGYLPVLVAAVVACAVVTVGHRRRLGPAIAVATLLAVAVPVGAAVQFQDQVYGGANVHDVVFTLVLPELGPDGPAALGLPPEAADVAGDGFFNGPPLPTADWWVRAIGEDADATRAAAHGALIRHPGALLRGLGVGLQATTRADLPYLAAGPGDPARPTGLGGDTGWSGSQGPALAEVLDDSSWPAWLPTALVLLAVAAAGSSVRWRRREPAAARWCLAAGLAAVTALGLVAAAVLGDGYFEVFKHVWLAAYLLVLSGLGLLGAGGAVVCRALSVRYPRRPGSSR